jgi:hypothetical protein
MNLIFRGLMFGCLTAVIVGCGASSSSSNLYPDPQPVDAGGGKNVGGVDAGTDVTLPPPVAGQGNILLFTGPAEMISHGSACTNEVGATADRWCAFTSPSANSLDGLDLFVINVSKAVAGTAISCAGGNADTNCLKLTAGFFEEASTPFPHAAGFQGDTLVYFDTTGMGYGWRPGMVNGRALVAADKAGAIHDCVPSAKGKSVECQMDLATQPVDGVTQVDLMVGRLDAVGDPPLVRVDTVISNDSTVGSQRFRVGLSPDGEYFAWSSSATAGGVETLKTQKVGDPSTLITVATDVSRWLMSPDGSRWYWLSQFNYDTSGMRSGTLQMAPFPQGTAPVTLLSDVGDFSVTRAGAIVARTMVTKALGDLQAIPDPVGAPMNVTLLDTGVVGTVSIGPKGYVAYTKSYDSILQVLDLYVKNLDGNGMTCALTKTMNAVRSLFFLPGGGGVLWAQITNLATAAITDPLDIREAYTRLSDCNTVTVASKIGSFGIVGDSGVLIEDQVNGSDGTLSIQTVTDGATLGASPPVLIQTRVNNYTPVTTTPGVVLFTVAAGSPSDGLYFHPMDTSTGAGGPMSADGGQ